MGSTQRKQMPALCRFPKRSDYPEVLSYSSLSPRRTLWKKKVKSDLRKAEIKDVELLPDLPDYIIDK